MTVVPTSRPTSTGRPKTAKNDDFIEYVNQPMVGRKWNEHEYYVKAKNDMRKHHHEKVAKVCVCLFLLISVLYCLCHYLAGCFSLYLSSTFKSSIVVLFIRQKLNS